ncbi:MAG: HEPN domain-containing protein [Tunicatimonas sp.]|uniref:HEPN domain-containing protein n=1 Tax=Tunicatimonas sp. TaxID=1940096 RepID=UPI003C7710A3
MTSEERSEYVKYRIESARKTLKAAKVLARGEYWNSAANRIYYAVFYAVNALLVLNHIHTKSHSATKTQFSLYFVETGKIDKKYGRLLSELFDLRQKGDYENVVDYDGSMVGPLFESVDEMIKIIETEINKTKTQKVTPQFSCLTQ